MATQKKQGNTQAEEPPLQSIREVMLEVIEEFSTRGQSLSIWSILNAVANRCEIRTPAQEQAVLTVWHDFFRFGLLSEGINFSNPTFPDFHITSRGREVLKCINRDPANPDGYLAYLASKASLDDVSQSYLEEAVHAFNSSSFKSAAVMIGAAAESLILCLRDKLVAKLSTSGTPLPTGLNDWRIKTVQDALTTYFDSQKRTMPRGLRKTYDAYWLAFAEPIRRVRNDSGHPQSVHPVSEDAVHASLLIFPELAHLISELQAWIAI